MKESVMMKASSSPKLLIVFALIATISLFLSGCTEEDEKTEVKLKIDMLPETIVEPFDNATTVVNFTLESKLDKDSMIFITDVEWENVLSSEAITPQVVFYVDELISANKTKRIYIANETLEPNKAFFPKEGKIKISINIMNTDQNFRSATLKFVINSSETKDKKTVRVDVRYL